MRFQFAALLAMSAILSGCVSVLPEPETPDALYRIEALQTYPGLSDDLIVREPEAPRLLAGQGLVSAASDGALRLIPGVEWSGSATRQLQLAMLQSFETGAEGHAVLPELGVIADYELASHLSAFELTGETARCELKVTLLSTGDRNIIARTVVTSDKVAASRSGQDRALALRAAGSDCAAQAAQFAIENLPAED